jgi:hypothetical protein
MWVAIWKAASGASTGASINFAAKLGESSVDEERSIVWKVPKMCVSTANTKVAGTKTNTPNARRERDVASRDVLDHVRASGGHTFSLTLSDTLTEIFTVARTELRGCTVGRGLDRAGTTLDRSQGTVGVAGGRVKGGDRAKTARVFTYCTGT